MSFVLILAACVLFVASPLFAEIVDCEWNNHFDRGVKLPPQPDEAREGSQSPDDGRDPGIGQNPSETTTPNTEHRV